MNKEDKKLQKHLVGEMMKVSKTNPDVMIYMQALMENYEKLEQEINRLNNIINELEKWIDEYYKSNRKWYNTELSSHDMRYYQREYINTEAMLIKFDKKLKELKEEK